MLISMQLFAAERTSQFSVCLFFFSIYNGLYFSLEYCMKIFVINSAMEDFANVPIERALSINALRA